MKGLILHESAIGIDAYGPESGLLKSRMLFFTEEVKAESANELIEYLLFLDKDAIERFMKKTKVLIDPGVYEGDEEIIPPEYEDVEYETYRQRDVMSIAKLVVLEADEKEPFWSDSARVVIASLIAYVLEVLPREEQKFGSVSKLFRQMCHEIEHTESGCVPEVSFFTAFAGLFSSDKEKSMKNDLHEKTLPCFSE